MNLDMVGVDGVEAQCPLVPCGHIAHSFPMSLTPSCFVWKVHGLNGCACRNVVREFLVQQRTTVVCLQETKLSVICNALANETLGSMFDYAYVPAVNVSGGILLKWHREL